MYVVELPRFGVWGFGDFRVGFSRIGAWGV